MSLIFGGKSIELVGDMRIFGGKSIGDMRMSKCWVEIDGQPLPSQIHSITDQRPPVDKKDDNVYPYPKIERDKDSSVDFSYSSRPWSG